jgi:hypothetical protein
MWSFIFIITFAYNIMYIPFAIGLDYHLPKELLFIDILAVLLTFLDSLLRPFLAIDKRLEISTNKSKRLKNYIKHNFAMDVIASVPFDYILLLLDNSPAAAYFRILRLLKVYRLSEI